jgi:hypothetical protein
MASDANTEPQFALARAIVPSLLRCSHLVAHRLTPNAAPWRQQLHGSTAV